MKQREDRAVNKFGVNFPHTSKETTRIAASPCAATIDRMYLTLYLATRDEQPLSESPALRVEGVTPAAENVRQWFSLPAVRFIGADTGCSCGFRHVVAEEPIEYWDGMFGNLDAKQD